MHLHIPTPFSSEIYASASSSIGLSVICSIIIFCQWLQTLFLCNCRTGTSFRTIRTIQVLYYNQCLRMPESVSSVLLSVFPGPRYLKYLIFLLFQISQIRQSLIELLRSCSSFREPVASFLYREINGMVLPSSINLYCRIDLPFLHPILLSLPE